MKIYQTTLQHKQNHYPSAFDFNRIIYKRSKVQTASAKKELYRLEMGHLGEEKLVEYLQTYGKNIGWFSKMYGYPMGAPLNAILF